MIIGQSDLGISEIVDLFKKGLADDTKGKNQKSYDELKEKSKTDDRALAKLKLLDFYMSYGNSIGYSIMVVNSFYNIISSVLSAEDLLYFANKFIKYDAKKSPLKIVNQIKYNKKIQRRKRSRK